MEVFDALLSVWFSRSCTPQLTVESANEVCNIEDNVGYSIAIPMGTIPLGTIPLGTIPLG